MQRATPKRAISIRIDEFSTLDQRVLIAAHVATLKMAIIGFSEGRRPHVVSVGQPEGLSPQEARAENMKAFSLSRIRGLDGATAEATKRTA